MKIAKLAGGGLLAFTLAVACGGMSGHAGGSNTNWFASCESTAECGKGLECWCGICTEACSTECGAHAGAACINPPASCTDPSRKTACAVGCTKDADCSDVGTNASCIDSICRKASNPKEDSGTPLSCDERSSQIAARVKLVEDAVDRSCSTTADCVDFPRVGCEGGCDSALASKAGAARVASEISGIEKDLCDPFTAAGCQALIPPCVFPGNPACVAGKCQRALGQPPDSSMSSCDSIANDIVDRLTTVTEDADTACQKDADCTRSGPGASCLPDCPYRPVSQVGAAAIASERAAVERDGCSALDAQGCSPLIYTCVAIPATPPVCVGGKCQDAPSDAGSKNSPPGDAGLSCTARTAQLRAELEAAANRADRKCTLNSDCTTVTLANQCYVNCTYVPASGSGANTIQDTLSSVERTECPAFKDAGCSIALLPCRAPPGATCQAGVCALAP